MNNKNIFLISIVILLIIIISSVVISQNFQEESSTQNSLEDKESTIIQYPAVLDQPVKWKKSIITNSPSNITLKLPKDSKNINIKKIKDNKKEDITYTSSITGAIISENLNESVIVKFLKKILGALTGKVIDPGQEEEIEIKINNNSTEYEIEYETPAPYAVEEDIDRGKRIKIVGPETIHYENVLAFTNLPNESSKNSIKLYRTTAGIKERVQITNYQDSNNNGLIDYIEWIVPQLSNQTYELIIEITKAEHLDSEKDFISDIYEKVKELDDVWSETISNNEYVRITFEENLTSENDITIYPRTVTGNPRVEVYEIDGTDIIAEFTSINSNQYNKVYLTNLQEEQDVFDLKIVGGSLEFDYIVDPEGEQLDNPSFTDGYSSWALLVATYDPNTFQDFAGSIQTFALQRVTSTGYVTQDGYDDYFSTDTVIFSCYYKFAPNTDGTGQFYAEIEDETNLGTWIPIWNSSEFTTPVDWTSSGNQNVSEHFSDGSYRLRLIEVTYAANKHDSTVYMDNCSLYRSLAVDITAPIITVVSPLNQNYTITTIDFNVSLNENTDWCGFSLDETANVTMTKFNNTYFNYTNSSMTQGQHNITFSCNDTFGNMNASAGLTYFTVDSQGPILNNENSNETNITQNSYFCLNITATDSVSGVDTVYAEVWNTTHLVNYTMNDTGTSCGGGNGDNVYGVEIHGTAQGIWNYSKAHANDTLNNWNSSDFADLTINVTAPADNNYPQFSDFQEDPINDSDYLFGQSYQFNSTITYTNGTIYLSFNNTNYSASNISDEFYVDFNSLSAGTYNYFWWGYGNGSQNHYNSSDTRAYVIQKINPVASLTNVTDPWTVTYPEEVTINYSESNDGDGNVVYKVWRDNVDKGSEETVLLGNGTYNYVLNTTGGTNYTTNSSIDAETFTVQQNTGSCSVVFNESSNITYPATFKVWTNCTSDFVLYRNGAVIANNSPQNLAADSYNFTVIRNDTVNYSNYYDEREFIVQQAIGEVHAWIDNQQSNKSVLLYSEKWLNATLETGQEGENITLYYNNTLIEQGPSPLYNLTNFTGEGVWNVSGIYDGNENYTSDIETWWVTVSTDSAPNVNIIYPDNITYNVNVSVLNYTANDDIDLSHCWYSLNGGANSSPDADCSNHTGLTSSEGSNNWTIWANDSTNQIGSDIVFFTKDTIYPQVNIIYPENTNYTVNVSKLNYTYTETNPDKCWWSNSSGVWNSSPQTCGTNWTGLTSKEGSNTWTVYINDTTGNENSSPVTFNKDTAYPAVTINSPLNETYNTNSILFNVTATDGSDVDSCWYSLTAGSYNYSMAETNPPEWDDTNSSMTQGSHTVNFYCNDTLNNLNDTEQETFFIDSIIPLMDFTTGTEDNSTTHSRDWIFVNVTVTETNEDTITFSLYNQTAIVNETSYTNQQRTINWTGLPNEKYYYNVTINDTAGNSNSTGTRTIILDTEGPQVSSLTESPTDPANYSESETYMFNATVIDPSLDIVWVDFNGTNYTATNIAGNIYNITLNNLAVGTYNYRWYANDSFSNLNGTENGTYTINQGVPNLTLTITPSTSEEYGTETTANRTGCPSQLICNLYRNDTGEITPPDVATLGVGAYNYTYNTTGNVNYTSTSVSDILTINKETGVVYTYLDNNRSNITINQQDYIWLNGTLITGQIGENITLYKNGSLINQGSSPLSNLTQFNNTGLHNITTTYDGNENYTSAYETWWVNVLEIDTTKPNVSIVYPSNNTNTTNANINVNYTVSDNQAVDSCWYSNDTYPINTSLGSGGSCINITTVTWSEGQHNVTVWANDTSGNENSSSVTFFVDSINPTIQFVSPTETSGTSLGRNYIQVNITASDDNLDTITIRLYNSTSDLIKTNYSTNPFHYINYTGLTAGTYFFNATANDTLNNQDSTETKNVTLVLPSLTIIRPENETYLTNTSLLLNYTASYEDFVLYNINGTNLTITGNTTFNTSEGQHTLYLYANNSVGTTIKNVTFTVNLTKFIIHYGNYHEGNSTNFNISSYEDLQNISNVILENTDGGKISFNEPINLTDDLNASDNEVDINSNINISSNRIEINSDALPNFNKSATLHFYGLSLSNPRVLRDEIVCPSVICTSPVYSSEAWVFNVTGFTAYSLEETPANGGNGVTPSGGGGIRYECSQDLDCKSGQYCLDHNCYEAECSQDSDCEEKDEVCLNHLCVKLFDIKIIDFESPAKLGEFFEFTYLMKGMANISGDVEVNFWIEKDGEKVTSGSDTIYLGSFEEKTETTKIFLPTSIKSGVYTFYIQVLHQAYEAKSHRTIEIEVKEGIAEITPIDKEFKNYYFYYIIGVLLLIIFIIFSKDKWLASLREWKGMRELQKLLKVEDIGIKKKTRRFFDDLINFPIEFGFKKKKRIYRPKYKPEKPIDEKLEPPEPELEPVEKPEHLQILKKKFAEQMVEEVKKEYPKQPIKALKTKEEKQKETKPKEPLYKPVMETKEEIPKEKEEESMNIIEDIVKKEQEEKKKE